MHNIRVINGELRAMTPPPPDIFYEVGRIFIKQMWLRMVGEACVSHAHEHDHVTLLAYGAVQLDSPDLAPKRFTAPAFIEITAGDHHRFTALVPNTMLYCIHDTHGLTPSDLGESFKGGA